MSTMSPFREDGEAAGPFASVADIYAESFDEGESWEFAEADEAADLGAGPFAEAVETEGDFDELAENFGAVPETLFESDADQWYEPEREAELWAEDEEEEEDEGEVFESYIPALVLPPVAFEAADLGAEAEDGSGTWPSQIEDALAWSYEEPDGLSPFAEAAFSEAPGLEILGETAGVKELPFLLAGPIVREATPKGVWLWFACSEEIIACTPQLTEYGKDATLRRPYPVAEQRKPDDLRVARLGERLWVAMVRVRPRGGAFTWGIYGYNLAIRGKAGGKVETKSLGLAYAPFDLPTFVLDKDHRRIAQGSCRRPGGFGPDAFPEFSKWLSKTAKDIAKRPSALILTGDQIYADDVTFPLFRAVRALARDVFGYVEQIPTATGTRSVDFWKVDDWRKAVDDAKPMGKGAEIVAALNKSKRKGLTFRRALPHDTPGEIGFTTEDGEGHLLSFAEFAAMYLLVWNPLLCVQYRLEDATDPALIGFTAAVLEGRRVLANTPTYMLFDDHEITDDWNMDRDMVKAMAENPTARRIVANALAAFWAFQAWGNDPSQFDLQFRVTITKHLDKLRVSQGAPGPEALPFDEVLHRRHWSFVAATNPPALCVDIRTRRDFPAGKTAILSGPKVWKELTKLKRWKAFRDSQRGKPLLIVLPTPLLGHPSLPAARNAKKLFFPRNRYEGDFELYGDNPDQRFGFVQWLHDELDPASLIVFSGDVHFGSVIDGLFVAGADKAMIDRGAGLWAIPTVQVTSSAIKNIKEAAFVDPLVLQLPGGRQIVSILRATIGPVGERLAEPLFRMTPGEAGDLGIFVNMHESGYKKFEQREHPAQLTMGLRADTRWLDVKPGSTKRTFLYENNFCVVTLPAKAGESVTAEFVMIDHLANPRSATLTLPTRGAPLDFPARRNNAMTLVEAAQKAMVIGKAVIRTTHPGVRVGMDVLGL